MTSSYFLITAALLAGGLLGSSASCGPTQPSSGHQIQAPELQVPDLQAQVRSVELAFAKTMADRDHEAFSSFLSEETVFFNGLDPLRGRQVVADAWKPLFEGPQASFSWEPEVVEVLDSGTLALSSGPIKDSAGNRVGTFNSIWRREASGEWRILFDKGCPVGDQ
jgi:ketosteroid isomerase-like protein